MKYKILLIEVVVLPVLLMSAQAVDIFGNWIAQAPIQPGWPEAETIFSFRVDGTKLTGKVSDPRGETTIRDGKINGDVISFFVMRSFSGKEKKISYKGKVRLNEIMFTVEEEGESSQAMEYIAKREFQRNQDVPLYPVTKPVKVPSPPIRIPQR